MSWWCFCLGLVIDVVYEPTYLPYIWLAIDNLLSSNQFKDWIWLSFPYIFFFSLPLPILKREYSFIARRKTLPCQDHDLLFSCFSAVCCLLLPILEDLSFKHRRYQKMSQTFTNKRRKNKIICCLRLSIIRLQQGTPAIGADRSNDRPLWLYHRKEFWKMVVTMMIIVKITSQSRRRRRHFVVTGEKS